MMIRATVRAHKNTIEFFSIFLLLTILGITLLYVPEDLLDLLIEENGPIEMMTAVGLFVAAVLLLWSGYMKRQQFHFTSGIVVLCLGLRELDFHCRFTTMGIFKSRFFLSEKVPVNEKIIGSVIVLLMFFGLIWYTKAYYKRFMINLRNGQMASICIALAMGIAIFSKTLDRMSDQLNALISSLLFIDPTTFIRILEETSELAIPFFILLAIMENRHGYQNRSSSSQRP
ncbi:hypothetical protein [Desulfosediminicola ganghwensis]|uniref:hypothetical protein n=1 Tax=Desulfosediminicola ganghwensis TaxID=2569540 RepID=UPI0010AD05ED|nr:hypothetical protein [Desulfosediminicola ganghwensis]